MPPSDAYVRGFLYLLYTLIKLYYTKALSDPSSSLALDWIRLLRRARITASYHSAATFQHFNSSVADIITKINLSSWVWEMKLIHCDCCLVKYSSNFNYVLYPQYFYIHRSLLLRSLCTPNNRCLVSSDYFKDSFHNFSNVSSIRTRWSREKSWNFKWSLRTLKKKKI